MVEIRADQRLGFGARPTTSGQGAKQGFAGQQPKRGRRKKIRVAAFLKCGELCGSCSRHRCENEPSQAMPISVPCPRCEGGGCEACDSRGTFDLVECPRQYVGHRISSAANLARFAGQGILPEPGGLLDQDAWTISVWNHLESDTQRIEEERRKQR